MFGFKIQLSLCMPFSIKFPHIKVLFGLVIDIIHMNKPVLQHKKLSLFLNMIMCLVLKFKVSCLHYTLVVSNSCFITCITCIELNTQILTTNGQLSLILSLYFYSLSSFYFIVFVAKEKKEKENCPKKVIKFGYSNNIVH
jgi:hypothetical protein